jgi:hypothetical protein
MVGLRPNAASDTSGDTIPLTSKIDPALKQWVEQYAASVNKSLSQVVREALRAYKTQIEEEDQ